MLVLKTAGLMVGLSFLILCPGRTNVEFYITSNSTMQPPLRQTSLPLVVRQYSFSSLVSHKERTN